MIRSRRCSLSDAVVAVARVAFCTALALFVIGPGLNRTAAAQVKMTDPDFRFSSNPELRLSKELRDWKSVAPRGSRYRDRDP